MLVFSLAMAFVTVGNSFGVALALVLELFWCCFCRYSSSGDIVLALGLEIQ